MSIPGIGLYEEPKASYEKRFFASHYSYRDYYSTTTGPDPTATTASYIFGAAARAVNARNWPRATNHSTVPPVAGDARGTGEPPAQNTYANTVMVQCTEDAFIIITSMSPRYIRLYLKYLIGGLTPNQAINRLSGEGVSATITEVPMFIPANAMMTFYPTMGAAITFFQSTASGTIRIWAEGNGVGLE